MPVCPYALMTELTKIPARHWHNALQTRRRVIDDPAQFLADRHKKTPACAGAFVSNFRGGLLFSFQIIASQYQEALGGFDWSAIAGFDQHFQSLLD